MFSEGQAFPLPARDDHISNYPSTGIPEILEVQHGPHKTSTNNRQCRRRFATIRVMDRGQTTTASSLSNCHSITHFTCFTVGFTGIEVVGRKNLRGIWRTFRSPIRSCRPICASRVADLVIGNAPASLINQCHYELHHRRNASSWILSEMLSPRMTSFFPSNSQAHFLAASGN